MPRNTKKHAYDTSLMHYIEVDSISNYPYNYPGSIPKMNTLQTHAHYL